MAITKVKGEKKNGLQKYRVRVSYKTDEGKFKQVERTVYGSEEAKLVENKLLLTTTLQVNTGMTLEELYNEYIESKKHVLKETSIQKTKSILQYHILPYLKNKHVTKLTPKMLMSWKLNIGALNIKTSTKNNAYKEFRALLNYAVNMEYINKNPLLKVGNFKNPNEIINGYEFYTPDEFLKFITVAKDQATLIQDERNIIEEWHYYVLFNVAFYTGMRKGEIHALKWTDIKDNHINISRSIAQKLKDGDRETPPKNKSSIRCIEIPKPLKKILDEHYQRCKDNLPRFDDSFRVCGGYSCLRDTTIEKRNLSYSKLAQVKKIKIHEFRHSHASYLANEGINIQEISKRLGHSKTDITWNTYSHLYPKESEKATNALNKIK